MAYNVLMYISRKEGTSPEEFKEYYENKHIHVIQRISGDAFPTLHQRHYIGYVPQQSSSEPKPTTSFSSTGDERVKAAADLLAGSASSPNTPMVIMGQSADFDWDVCSIITYSSETHFRQFMAVMLNEENAKTLAEDEEKFMDRSKFKAVILGDVYKTTNNSGTEN